MALTILSVAYPLAPVGPDAVGGAEQILTCLDAALVRAGQPTAALPLLARARRLAWSEPLSHLHYGIGLLEAGRPARAAALFRRTVAMLKPSRLTG